MPDPDPDVASELCSTTRSIHVCLLLLLRGQPAHGYGLVLQLQALGITDHNRGRVYRALRWLEDARLVACRWDTPPVGPARRIYEILPAGSSALDQAVPRLASGARPPEDLLSRLVMTLASGSPAGDRAP